MAGPQPELLSDIVNLILANAEECLVDGGRPPFEKVFHHQGPRRPPGDCCDYLAIFVRQIRPTTDSEQRLTPFPGTAVARELNCTTIQMALDLSLAFVRPCFPGVTGNKVQPFPEAEAMQVASDDLTIDARVLWCCLIAAQHQGQLLPEPMQPDDVVWGVMAPFRGGGCAGWQWDFTVLVPPCCWEAPPIIGSGS